MATTKDCVQLAIEENPLWEGALAVATTGPNRVSTNVHYPAIQTGLIGPNPAQLDRVDEVRGYEGAPPELLETYAPDGNITIRAYLNSLTWLLQCAGLVGTHTTGDGIITDPDAATIPATAHRWVFTKRTGYVPKTMQLQACYANYGVFLKGNGFGVTQLSGNAAGAITAQLMGLVLARIADPNLTPSFDAASIAPARRGDFTLQTWLASSGSTDDFTWQIDNPLAPRSSLGLSPSSYFPDQMVRGDTKVRMTGTIPKFSLAAADIDRLLDVGTFVGKMRWKTKTNILATAYPYSMWIEMPAAQLLGGNADPVANRPHFGGSYNWVASWDETAGYDFRITIVNSVAAIETYP